MVSLDYWNCGHQMSGYWSMSVTTFTRTVCLGWGPVIASHTYLPSHNSLIEKARATAVWQLQLRRDQKATRSWSKAQTFGDRSNKWDAFPNKLMCQCLMHSCYPKEAEIWTVSFSRKYDAIKTHNVSAFASYRITGLWDARKECFLRTHLSFIIASV